MNKIERSLRSFFGLRLGSAEPRSCSLAIRNVTCRTADGRALLDGASLELDPGSTTCVVGSTHDDQTALMTLVLGLDEPESGAVVLDGRNISRLPVEKVRGLVAVVLADPWLTEGSVADNIAFGRPGITHRDIVQVCDDLGLGPLIDSLPDGFETLIGEDGDHAIELPLGQRRRIATARAVLRNPGLLLFEEPTRDLDGDEEQQMLQTIDLASAGRTTILATHRLSLARRADTVMVIDRGRLVPYNRTPDGLAPKTTDRSGPDHAALWDLRVPPIVVPANAGRDHLRIVRAGDRRAPHPVNTPWGIAIGGEMAPGFLASGLLGRDDHTETWVAWSIEREEPVRIKIPRHDPVTYPAFEQLFREHKTLSGLHHPALAKAYDVDLEAEMPFVVFEYLDSDSLAGIARKATMGLEPLDVLYTGFELAAALNHLHQRGFAHLGLRSRDIRTRDDTIVITDFTHIQEIGSPLRTPVAAPDAHETRRFRPASHRPDDQSLAPEYAPGRPVDVKMDVFALGSLMHRATAGSVVTAMTADGMTLAPYATVTGSAPKMMADMIDRMLARDPDARPGTDEVLSQFRQILPRSMVRPRTTTRRARSRRLHLVGSNN